jgi:hypothetical protein
VREPQLAALVVCFDLEIAAHGHAIAVVEPQ